MWIYIYLSLQWLHFKFFWLVYKIPCCWNLGCFLFFHVNKLLLRTFFYIYISLPICGNTSGVHNPWNGIAVTGYSHFTFWWILPYCLWSNSCKLILSFQCAVGNSCQCTLVFIHYVYIKYKLVCLVLWKIESNEIKKSFFVKQSFTWKEKELVFCTCRVMGDPWLIALVKKETSYVIVTHFFLYQH